MTLLGMGLIKKPGLSLAPDQISDLVVWHKADAGVWADTGRTTPATDGSNVAAWDDQSGNGHHLVADWPYYTYHRYRSPDATLTGPTIELPYGLSGGFYKASWSPVTGANARTIVAVGRAFQGHLTAGMGHIVHWGLGTNGNAYGLTAKTAGAQKFGNHYWGSSWQAADRVDDPVILVIAYDGSVDHFWLNGGTEVTNTVTINTISGSYNIGRRVGGSEYGYGFFAEIAVYSHFLTKKEREALQSYLAKKWGIAL